MKKTKKAYQKPSIKTKKTKINFFQSNNRIFDSFDELLAPNVLATSHGGGCGSGSCFLKGTQVLMEDTQKKNIEEIKNGDVVLSYDTNKEILVKNTVKKCLEHEQNPGGYFIINEVLKITGNHTVWLPKQKQWKAARDLRVGDILKSKDAEVTIDSMTHVEGIYDVYNLSLINEPHNYLAENIVVHNEAK